MNIDPGTITYLARLARLQLEDQEIKALQSDLERIVSYIELLGELQTNDTQEDKQVSENQTEESWDCHLREDVVKQGLAPEQWQPLAPDCQGRHFRVPRVVG